MRTNLKRYAQIVAWCLALETMLLNSGDPFRYEYGVWVVLEFTFNQNFLHFLYSL